MGDDVTVDSIPPYAFSTMAGEHWTLVYRHSSRSNYFIYENEQGRERTVFVTKTGRVVFATPGPVIPVGVK